MAITFTTSRNAPRDVEVLGVPVFTEGPVARSASTTRKALVALGFEGKVGQTQVVPQATGPDVIVVSGDHSTPTQMAAHSWHPVPALLWSEHCGRDDVDRFGERWCRQGGLGLRPTKDLMALMLANAGRLQKYGA